MTTEKKEVAVKSQYIQVKELFQNSKVEIEKALPKHVNADRMLRIALTEARKVPALLECTPQSFLGAVLQASQLGLEPGSGLGQCYLIPYDNRKTGQKEVQLQFGYQGFIDLMSRSSLSPIVTPTAVYQGDEFEYEKGLQPKLIHKPALVRDHKAKLTHVYAIAALSDGRREFDVMNRSDIDAIRSRSKSRSGPWDTDFEAMAKKTIIRRMFKYLPKSVEIQRAVSLDEQAEIGESQHNDKVLLSEDVPIYTKGERVEKRMSEDLDNFENFKK